MKFQLMVLGMSCVAIAARAQPQHSNSEQQTLAALDACIARLDPALDVGYARVVVRCPNLSRSLEQSGWAEWLPRGWKEARNDLSAGSLVELRTLVARELEAPPVARTANVKRLNEVLNGLGPAARERSSLWSRFRAWLRTVVERNKQADRGSWLDKMIQHSGRSQAFIDLLTYAALAAIIGLACVILINELRAAGLIKARKRTAEGDLPFASAQQKRVQWRDIEQATAADKPRLLLELVVAKLTELRRIPPASALTVRELARVVELTDTQDRTRLSQIAMAAERARYSATPPAPETIDQTVRQGRELLERLASAA